MTKRRLIPRTPRVYIHKKCGKSRRVYHPCGPNSESHSSSLTHQSESYNLYTYWARRHSQTAIRKFSLKWERNIHLTPCLLGRLRNIERLVNSSPLILALNSGAIVYSIVYDQVELILEDSQALKVF